MSDERPRIEFDPSINRDTFRFHRYLLGEKELILQVSPKAFEPAEPSQHFAETLFLDSELQRFFQGRGICDIAAGNGYLGAWALAVGGAERATFTDINKAALQLTVNNLFENGLEERAVVLESDVFNQLYHPDGSPMRFDVIIANVPVQYRLPDTIYRSQGIRYNENDGGREVLDRFILQVKRHLNEGCPAFLMSSTRQGFDIQTRNLLNVTFGPNGWKLLKRTEYELDPKVLSPYMQGWIDLQQVDGDIRVWAKDENDNRISPPVYDPSLKWYSASCIVQIDGLD